MQKRFESDAGGNWEVLAQLGQYYRRGRIKTEVFQAVKKALAESALGRNIPVASEIAVAREIPRVPEPMIPEPMIPEIPVALEVALPQITARSQRGDSPPPPGGTTALGGCGGLRTGSATG